MSLQQLIPFQCRDLFPSTSLRSHLDRSDDGRDTGWGHGSSTPRGTQPCCPCRGHITPKVLLCPPTCWSAEGPWGFLGGRRCRRCSKVSLDSCWGRGSSKNWSMGWPRAMLCTKNIQGEGMDHVGWGHQPSPAKDRWSGQGVTLEAKCDGSPAARANRKLTSALISPN